MGSISPLEPFMLLTRYLTFPDRDQYQWWHHKGYILGRMLQDCQYSEHQQYQYLIFFHQHLIPALGAFTTQGTGDEGTTLLSGGGKLEFSLTFTSHRSSLRIAFEPTSMLAGTNRDPYNKRPINELFGTLEKLEGVELSLDIYRSLASHLVVSDGDERILQTQKQKEAQGVFYKTQNILAFNLVDGFVHLDLYVHPQLRSLVTGKSTESMIFDAIRSIDSAGRLASALDMLHKYLRTTPLSTNCMFLSHDLCDPSQALARIFLSESYITWDRIENIWTLGGTQQDPIGLAAVKILWQVLDIKEGTRGPDEFPLLFAMELHQEEPLVRPKIGIPMVGRSEIAIAETCVRFFSRLGWVNHPSSYATFLHSYYPDLRLEQSLGKQAWLGLSYTEGKGPVFTIFHY